MFAAQFTRVSPPSVSVKRTSIVPRAANQINESIKKDEDKVVDMLNASDLPKKAVFCRCWRSKTFPMCNGSHKAFNEETGDNVGPLIVDKSK